MHSYKNCCLEKENFKKITCLCSLLKIVSDKNRLKILFTLERGSCCVCEVVESLDIPQSLVSHHLSALKKEKLVQARKKGRRAHYKLTERGEKVVSLVNELSRSESNV